MNKTRKLPWLLIFATLILAGGALWFGMHLASKPERVLRIQAERVILDSIKTPATAKITTTLININEKAAQVEGFVDAQNVYGAVIRSRWSVTFEREGNVYAVSDSKIAESGENQSVKK